MIVLKKTVRKKYFSINIHQKKSLTLIINQAQCSANWFNWTGRDTSDWMMKCITACIRLNDFLTKKFL